jgi:hypothetical protein
MIPCAVMANPYLDSTVGAMLGNLARRFPGREAIVAPDRRVTYADLYREAGRFARALLALGVRKNDKVALWLPNRPAWLVAQHACGMIGAVVVALNTRYKAQELGYILRQSDSTTLLLADHLGPIDFLDTLQEVLPTLRDSDPGELDAADFPHLRRVIVEAEDPHPGCLRLSDVLDDADEPGLDRALAEAGAALGPDDPFTILYTSGTTSFPKGAVITHRNCLPHGWHCGEVMRITEKDRVLHALPFSGTWGGLCIPLATFTRGACLVLMESFEPGLALHLMERERITVWVSRQQAHVRTICVWMVRESRRPVSSVIRVCQTMVRFPRWSGVASARTVPERPAAKKLVLDSSVVVPAPGGRFSTVAVAPTVSASAIRVPPWRLPPTVLRSSLIASWATSRSGLASTIRMPRSSANVPPSRSEIAAGSISMDSPPLRMICLPHLAGPRDRIQLRGR